jgi:hypothetical protein
MLRITEATCRYAAAQLSNGAGPDEARETALFVAGELELVAGVLRRVVLLGPSERRELARELDGAGWSRREIADRLRVSGRAVRDYLRPDAGTAGDGGEAR